MPNPAWGKRKTDEPIWLGPRVAPFGDIGFFDEQTQYKIEIIFEGMDREEVIVFNYDGSERLVVPFVVGKSSEGNALMRGYQLEGISRSGKGGGWRVFQISKMGNPEGFQEFIESAEFNFDPFYPWTYWIF